MIIQKEWKEITDNAYLPKYQGRIKKCIQRYDRHERPQSFFIMAELSLGMIWVEASTMNHIEGDMNRFGFPLDRRDWKWIKRIIKSANFENVNKLIAKMKSRYRDKTNDN